MIVKKLEVTRNEEISDQKGYPADVNYIAVIEEYQLSDKFILIDLENVEKRDKKYKRCGFSTRRKIERTNCGSEAMDERKRIKSSRFK